MRPTLSRLVRLVPRSAVKTEKPILAAVSERLPTPNPPTLIEIMLEKQQKAGSDWPANLRIEPTIPKEAFKDMQGKVRSKLREMLRETW